MVTLIGLKEETKYYIALTAYNSDGSESRFSNSVCVQIIDSAIEMCSSSFNSSSGSGGCFISAAGLKNADPIALLFFLFQPFAALFTVLSLLLIATTRSIFLKITFKAQGLGLRASRYDPTGRVHGSKVQC